MADKKTYADLCINCVHGTIMLTGYGLETAKCDKCGRKCNLAICLTSPRETPPGEYELRACPLTPMTQEEMQRQCQIVSEAAEALDYFSEEELDSRVKKLDVYL